MRRRGWTVFWALLLCLALAGGRLGTVCLRPAYSAAAEQQALFTLTVDEPRGTVYDRAGRPLTNRQTVVKTVLTPTPQTVSAVHAALTGPELTAALAGLAGRRPFVLTTERAFAVPRALTFVCHQQVPAVQPAVHLVGMVNGDGNGVGGLQQIFNDRLRCTEPITVTYTGDAAGGALAGVAANQTRPPATGSVTATLDLAAQLALEQAARISRGAVVIQRPGSGEILAAASFPAYSPARADRALSDPDRPFFNRVTAAYNVGSVFKLCVAAAALEQGVSPERTYTCTGAITCGQAFHCHKADGHGTLTMTQALAQSCNPYFIDLAREVGGQAVHDMAVKLGFGRALPLWDDWTADAGSLPAAEELVRSPAALANFAIGQGSLMATPLHVNAMTACIAGGGVWYDPLLVLSLTDRSGKTTPVKSSAGRRVMSGDTAALLAAMMQTVVTEGTGRAAAPAGQTAAGKTATAQTGITDRNGAVTQAWFTGFCPADAPRYVITVLVEGGASGGVDAAPVFRAVCESLP